VGVKIIGVSFDSPEKNQEWALDEGFAFDLWSDLDRDLALHYGAATSETQSAASRKTYLLGADGYVVLEYTSVSTGTHPGEVLEDVQAIWGSE